MFVVYCGLVAGVSVWGSIIARKEEVRKEKAGWVFNEYDLKWTFGRIVCANLCSFVVGLLASFVGLGGGVSLNPTLLSFGFAPVTIAATSMFLIMISKLSAAILYSMSGLMPFEYWFFNGAFLIISSIIALVQLNAMIKKWSRQSIISFIFTFFMLLSLILIPYVGIRDAIQTHNDGGSIIFMCNPCKSFTSGECAD